jgi:hypothetical protein
VPVLAVNVCPCWATPVIAGRAEFTGSAAIAVAVGADATVALPPPLVAVTTTSMMWPTSVEATTYVAPVPTPVQPAPLQLSHA